MNISKLKTILLNGYNKSARRFIFDPNDLSSESVSMVVTDLLGLSKLQINRARKPVETETSLKVIGQSSIFGFVQAPTSVTFTVEEEQSQIEVVLTLPSDWVFTHTFPQLERTLFEEFSTAPNEESEPSYLIFTSYAHTHIRANGTTIQLAPGINLDILIAGAIEPFASLASVFPDLDQISFVGPVTPTPLGPNMQLVSTQELAIGSLTGQLDLPLTLALRSLFVPHEEFQLQEQGVELSTTFALDDVQIHLSALLPLKRLGVFNLRGDFTELDLPSPSAMAALIGVPDFNDTLPPFLPLDISIALKSMIIGLDIATPNIAYVFVGLGALDDKPWELVPGQISLNNVGLDLSVFDPFSNTRNLSVQLNAEIDIPAEQPILQLDAYAQAPAYAVQATLREDTTFNLTDLIAHFIPAAADVPDLVFDNLLLDVSGTTDDRQYELAASFAGTWQVDLPSAPALMIEDVCFQVGNSGPNGTLGGMLHGVLAYAGVEVEISANFGKQFILKGRIPQINFTTLARELGELTLPDEIPDFEFVDLDLQVTPKTGEFFFSGSSSTPWELPIGIDGLSISDITVDIQRSRDESGNTVVSGSIKGTINIGNASFRVDYAFPGELILGGKIPTFNLSPLIQDLCGPDAVRGLPVPISILELELNDLDVTIAPKSRSLSISASSPIGKTEAIIKRTSDGSWGFSLGIAPPETWRFSEIDPVLVVLDPLKFSSTALIVASSEDRSFALTTIDTPNTGTSIKRGLNFFATLDMRGLGVDELLGIEALTVYAAIGSSSKNLVIEAQIAGQFQLADNVAFGDIKFRLQPSPTDFAVTLLGTVITTIDDSPLRFTGGLGIRAIVTPPSFQARLQATMLGRWNNPMGAEGLAVADVALDLAIGFPPLRPSIGLAGTLQIGEFQGSVAVKIDTINPSQSMLAVAFNRLYLMDVIQTFTPPAVHQSIPPSIAQTVLDVGFEDVDIYIVPQPTSIGELFFDQGISLKGTMSIWGIRAFGYLSIDQTSGVLVEADVDEINIGGLFKLSGAGGRENAYLYLDLRVGGRPSIDISAAIELLGLRREVQLNISDEGFYFQMLGSIFNLFEASLEVRGGSLDNGDGIFVKATMRNDLLAYLREEATTAIQAAADGAVAELEEAQRTLSDAQREIQRINGSIDTMRRTVERERARDIKRLQDAQQAVRSAQAEVQRLDREIQHMRQIIQQERNRDIARIRSARDEVQSAQNKVNGLDRQIQSMRQTIRNERASSERNIRNARNEVQKAQNTVNTLQGEINSTKRAISRIDDQIRTKKRWLDGKKWWEKTWAGPEYAAYEAAKRIEQGALYTKIGGIEAAKHTAIGALEVAKQVLRGIEAGAKTFPIDADPRVASLFAARETANLALEAAKQVLHGIEAGAKTFPIDADPRVAALFAARESANVALEAAKQIVHGIELAAVNVPVDADPRIAALFAVRETATGALEVAKLGLEGVKQSVGGLAEVGQYIVDFGLGGLLDIREASFEGSLTATNGGHVKMAMTLSFMGDPHTLLLPFSFHNPLSGAKALADSLLPS